MFLQNKHVKKEKKQEKNSRSILFGRFGSVFFKLWLNELPD